MTTTQGSTDSTATDAAAQPRLRASDVDRAAAVRTLQDAVARGLLTPDEGSDRMATAFAAVHLSELAPLTADLPAARSDPSAPGWRLLAMMAVEQVRASLRAVPTGNLSRTRIAIAVLTALVVLLLVGSLVGDLLVDGADGPGRGGFGRDGFGRDGVQRD